MKEGIGGTTNGIPLTPQSSGNALRDKFEEALWEQAKGKDYYNAPLSVQREILDVIMEVLEREAQKEKS